MSNGKGRHFNASLSKGLHLEKNYVHSSGTGTFVSNKQ